MPITPQMLRTAGKHAEKSSMDHKLGCVIYSGRKVVASGFNLPLKYCSRHAEMSAIENLMRQLRLLNSYRSLLERSRHENISLSQSYLQAKVAVL
jgi:tRNA(Arg) A34 adenosine deaminase TadA